MEERRLTLTDVMIGIHKHGLVCKLSEESFTFLIGIILEHNERGFKPGFDMNNNQAMAAGGGNTPKSVIRRRNTLCKFKVEGKPLLEVDTGNFGKNTCAKYKIDYNSLCAYNGVWSGQTDIPSQIWSSSEVGRGEVEGEVVGGVTGNILRSEERRGEETAPQSPPNEVTTQTSSTDENGAGGDLDSPEEEKPKMIQKATNLQELILRKWPEQLEEKPDIGICKDALRAFEWDYNFLAEAVNQAPQTLTHPNPPSAVGCVLAVARRLKGELESGVDPALIGRLEKEVAGLKSDLVEAKKKPEENELWISQTEFFLEGKEASLKQLREG